MLLALAALALALAVPAGAYADDDASSLRGRAPACLALTTPGLRLRRLSGAEAAAHYLELHAAYDEVVAAVAAGKARMAWSGFEAEFAAMHRGRADAAAAAGAIDDAELFGFGGAVPLFFEW
mmetsp:Transcript_38225/g.119940  ORF Transcript_38225/g.119940 Transcript_38225/m.119940 type:complete len:122 (-) Transcript_38225:263-628(-)